MSYIDTNHGKMGKSVIQFFGWEAVNPLDICVAIVFTVQFALKWKLEVNGLTWLLGMY